MKRNLDLRLLIKTFQDRLQYQNGAAETHWVDLLVSRMKERVVAPSNGLVAQRKERDFALLRQIKNLPPKERLAVWVKETGKAQAVLYRRLNELNEVDSQISQNRVLCEKNDTTGTELSV